MVNDDCRSDEASNLLPDLHTESTARPEETEVFQVDEVKDLNLLRNTRKRGVLSNIGVSFYLFSLFLNFELRFFVVRKLQILLALLEQLLC